MRGIVAMFRRVSFVFDDEDPFHLGVEIWRL